MVLVTINKAANHTLYRILHWLLFAFFESSFQNKCIKLLNFISVICFLISKLFLYKNDYKPFIGYSNFQQNLHFDQFSLISLFQNLLFLKKDKDLLLSWKISICRGNTELILNVWRLFLTKVILIIYCFLLLYIWILYY